MAVQNRLQKAEIKPQEQAAIYQANGMEVKLTPTLVRDYLVSGNRERVTAQEVVMFINLCKFSGLNPWLKEAYCIKYGDNPATLVVGKEAFLKRAESHPAYDGAASGIITFHEESGEILRQTGSFMMPGETIVGAWAEVWRKDRAHSTRVEVSFDEYAGRQKNGELNSQWAKKPATMIRKVALVQALREAFPGSFGGMYAAEEQGAAEPEFTAGDVIEIEPPEEPQPEKTEFSEPVPSANDARQTLFG